MSTTQPYLFNILTIKLFVRREGFHFSLKAPKTRDYNNTHFLIVHITLSIQWNNLSYTCIVIFIILNTNNNELCLVTWL